MRKCILAVASLGYLSGCGAADDARAVGAGDPVAVATQALATVTFTDVHRNAMPWGVAGCDDRPDGIDRQLWGQEPDAAGTYPVFMYFVGWGGHHEFHTAQRVVEQMVSKGFVAASVGYTNGVADGLDCNSTTWKAQCAFDESFSLSAVARLCERPKADCSKGIVVMGHSLGGGVAILAKNTNPNVQAVVSIGAAESATLAGTYDECFRPSPAGRPPRALPPSRHLAIVGQTELFGIGPTSLNLVTGLACSTSSLECSQTPGAPMPTAGWYRVPNTAVADGLAGHCYMLVGNAWSPVGYNDYCLSPTLDPNWAPPAANAWSLDPTLNWLNGFVAH